ncbi:MAG: ComF family protein [Clostridia bacterium]|nr:ComF family protein [Clostridia bacterium]
MTRVFEALLDLLYPRGCVCTLCGREAITHGEVCDACAPAVRPCTEIAPPQGTVGFRAGLCYTPPVRGALHRFKYGRQIYLADFFAAHMTIPEDWRIDAILPVPLHPKRLRRRGFNQSELLCGRLGMRYAIPVRTDILCRVRQTPTQTALGVEERKQNVQGAFAAKGCEGLHLLLIDDVCTTGSTLSACAEALTKAGAASVYAMTAIRRERRADRIDME